MSVTRPRGPLPARVYWTRRLLVLAVAFGLVFGLARLLAPGGEDPGPVARSAASQVEETSSASPSAISTADARPAGRSGTRERRDRKPTRTPLALPTGPCADSDVRVVPSLESGAIAGESVRITLRLSTFASPACNWEVSPDTVAVKLTSGSDRIWTSQECSAAVPTEPVVLRSNKVTRVDVLWSGRRSDAECSRTTLWAQPGYYYVSAAALGSEPESEQFRLYSPAPVTITPTPTPKPGEKPDQKPDQDTGEKRDRQGSGDRGGPSTGQ